MELSNFESAIDQKIMNRGRKYFNDGFVENLRKSSKGLWCSSIRGTYLYRIEVMIDKSLIHHWYCDCPYNGPICKHVVATLFDIREIQNSESEKGSRDKTIKKTSFLTRAEELKKIIKTGTREEAIEKLEQFISEDKGAPPKVALQSTIKPEKKVTATSFRTSFHAIIRRNSSQGFIDYRSARGFSNETWELIETLRSSDIPANVRVDACFKILESLMKKVVNTIDDSNGELANITMHLSEVIAIAYPELTKAKQTNSFEQALFWEFESELGDYGLDQYIDYLAPMWAAENVDFQAQYLKTIDKALKGNTNDWKYESLNKKKFDQLLDWERVDEAKALAHKEMDIPEFRKFFVQKAIEDKDFKTATSLAKAGIKLATQRKHPGVVDDWRRTLVDIAKELNDVDSIRKELLKMQKDSSFTMSNYREFKATFTEKEWESVQAQYATQMLGKLYRPYDQAEVYLEENQLRELFDLIQAETFMVNEFLKPYLKILSKEFPEETSNFFAIIIHHDLEQTDRKVYQKAVKDIKILKKLAMGEAIAELLIKEVMAKYANRPSMLDIFRKAFGEIN